MIAHRLNKLERLIASTTKSSDHADALSSPAMFRQFVLVETSAGPRVLADALDDWAGSTSRRSTRLGLRPLDSRPNQLRRIAFTWKGRADIAKPPTFQLWFPGHSQQHENRSRGLLLLPIEIKVDYFVMPSLGSFGSTRGWPITWTFNPTGSSASRPGDLEIISSDAPSSLRSDPELCGLR